MTANGLDIEQFISFILSGGKFQHISCHFLFSTVSIWVFSVKKTKNKKVFL